MPVWPENSQSIQSNITSKYSFHPEESKMVIYTELAAGQSAGKTKT